MAKGFFAKNGLDIQYTGFGGSAKVQQGLAADAIDVGVSSGPELAFLVKGVPALGIAQVAGPPLVFCGFVRPNTLIKSTKDLNGKKLAVSTVGSLGEWLVKELSRREGWGSDGIGTVALGTQQSQRAAVVTEQVDGAMSDCSIGWELEKMGKAVTIASGGDIAPDFIMHVIYATLTK